MASSGGGAGGHPEPEMHNVEEEAEWLGGSGEAVDTERTEAQRALGSAVVRGVVPAVRRAVGEDGADVNAACFNWRDGTLGGTCTAAYLAARNGQIDVLRELLEHGADPDKGNPNNGDTPLGIACVYDQASAAYALLRYGGADPNLANKNGVTPCMWAVYGGSMASLRVLHNATCLFGVGVVPAVPCLDVNAVGTGGDFKGKTALDVALELRDHEAAEFLREMSGALRAADLPPPPQPKRPKSAAKTWKRPNAKGRRSANNGGGQAGKANRLPHAVVIESWTTDAAAVAASRATLDADDPMAAMQGDIDVLAAAWQRKREALLTPPPLSAALLAMPKQETAVERTALHEARELAAELHAMDRVDAQWLLGEATAYGDIFLMERAVAAGADVNAAVFRENGSMSASRGGGCSAAHVAAHENEVAALRFLVGACGVNPNAISDTTFGTMPIHAACGMGNPDTVTVLLALGADPNVTDKDGDAPLLYLAYHNGSVECLRALAAGGPGGALEGVNAVHGRDKETALDIAMSNNYDEFAEVLRDELGGKRGADLADDEVPDEGAHEGGGDVGGGGGKRWGRPFGTADRDERSKRSRSHR